jgi:inward rectifier potassium channel
MSSRPTSRKVRFGSGAPVTAIGLPDRPVADAYHLLLTWTWTRLFAFLGLTYVAVNALFALLYLSLGPGAIANARPNSFADTFFFAFDTMATIGYGNMYPATEAANLLSMLQAMIGLAGMAVTTGLVFAKFARPTARVLFSKVAVIHPFEGVPSLLFRMANARANQIVEAELALVMTRRETTAEGETIYRVHDLKLRRSRNAVFSLTWLAVHPITPDSPLYGQDAATLARDDVGFLASVGGLDEHFGQTIHARHSYDPADLAWGMRFVDILLEDERGDAVIDYRRFHEVEPFVGAAGSPPGGAPAVERATPRDP